MSNALAIAAVTKALQDLLTLDIQQTADGSLGDYDVKTNPPDQAVPAAADGKSRLNLFLYQTAMNQALRNMEMPGRSRPGETVRPVLAVNLYYLLTAYGVNDDHLAAHKLLGHAMRTMHDHAVLSPTLLQAALGEAAVHLQVEQIRIRPQPLSLDDLSKLWTMFQTQYRISAAYEVSVLLVESTQPGRTPLPVLHRNLGARVGLVPPYPTLLTAVPPHGEAGVELGQTLILRGHHLNGVGLTVRVAHPRLGQSVDLTPVPGSTATDVAVTLPDGSVYDAPGGPSSVPPRWRADWGPGLYTATLIIDQGGASVRQTGAVPFVAAPRVMNIDPVAALPGPGGAVTYTVECRPPVQPEQQALLLLGDRAVPAQAHTAVTDTLTFVVPEAAPGKYLARLRVDGADSLVIDRSTDPPSFYATAEVTIL